MALGLFLEVYNNINNYIFGNIYYTLLGGIVVVMAYLLANNLDIGTTLTIIFIGSVVGSFVFLPFWIPLLIMIIMGVLLVWAIIKITGG